MARTPRQEIINEAEVSIHHCVRRALFVWPRRSRSPLPLQQIDDYDEMRSAPQCMGDPLSIRDFGEEGATIYKGLFSAAKPVD